MSFTPQLHVEIELTISPKAFPSLIGLPVSISNTISASDYNLSVIC